MPICSRQNWIFLSKNLGLVLDLNGRISFFAGPTVNHVKSPCFVGIKIIFFAGSIPLQALASPPRYKVRSRAARGVRNKRCCTSWRTPETWRGTWHERQEDGRIHWDYGFSQEFWCLMTIPLGFTSYLPSNFHVWWQLIVIYKKKNTNRITGWKIWIILCYFQTWRWDDDSQWHAYVSGRLKPPPRVSNYSKLFKMGNDPAKTGSKMI